MPDGEVAPARAVTTLTRVTEESRTHGTSATDIQTLSVTVTGDDRPGVTGTLLGALSGVDAEVLDIQQVVVHGHLTLTVLLRPGAHVDQLRDAATSAMSRRSDGTSAPETSNSTVVTG